MTLNRTAVAMMATVTLSVNAMTIKMNELNNDLMREWDILFTNSSYRELPVHFDDIKSKPQWSAILNDAGHRYGIAYLLDMESKQLVVTRANSAFLSAGIHYVIPRINEQNLRYDWDKQLRAGIKEQSEHKFSLEQAEKRQEQAIIARNQQQVDDRVAAQRKALDKQRLEMKQELAEHKSKLEQQLSRYNASKIKFDIAKVEYEKFKAEAQTAQVQSLAQQKHFIQLETDLKREMQQNEQNLKLATEQLASEKVAYQRQVDQKYANRVQGLKDDQLAVDRLKAAYYPDAARTLAKGDAQQNISEFLQTNWRYNLSWSTELVDEESIKPIRFDYPLHFNEEDLNSDVSLIVCTLTRDIPGLSIYAEVDPSNRVVYMQLHKTTQSIRNRIISQCFD